MLADSENVDASQKIGGLEKCWRIWKMLAPYNKKKADLKIVCGFGKCWRLTKNRRT
jgi:hypothetical protein